MSCYNGKKNLPRCILNQMSVFLHVFVFVFLLKMKIKSVRDPYLFDKHFWTDNRVEV